MPKQYYWEGKPIAVLWNINHNDGVHACSEDLITIRFENGTTKVVSLEDAELSQSDS
jgi:hypothetical protein